MLGPGGEAFLEGLLQRAGSADVPGRLELSPRFMGAVDALEASGCLTAADAGEWRDRWRAAISDDRRPEAPRATRRADVSSAADERGGGIDQAPAFTGARLRRVIAPKPNALSDLPRPLGAELYEDGVVVRWAQAAPEPGGMPDLRVRVTDDVGTQFRMFAGGGHRIGVHAHQEMALVPAVPPDARVLYVELVDGTRLSVGLD